MKITLERLRRIITEEVIKEELDPEHAVPAISAMLKGMEATETSEVFGDVFTVLYGEEALEAEAEKRAGASGEEGGEEEFPTEYQPGGAEGDRPTMGFERSLAEIIKQELMLLEAEEGEEIMAAVEDLPTAAKRMADGIRKEIEALTERSGLDPVAMAGIVSELIQAEY